MEEERTGWPVFAGIAAGVFVGVVAAVYLYSSRSGDADAGLRDAKEIISQCRDQIKEIEQNLAALREPVSA